MASPQSNLIRRAPLLLLTMAALHVLFALLYAQATPYRTPGTLSFLYPSPIQVVDIGAPDERQHVNYVRDLLTERRLPVLRADDPQLGERYEAHQPPLYYGLAAGFSKLLGGLDLESPAGWKLRWLNALIGAGTVAGVYCLALWGFRDHAAALIAAAIAAFLPMQVALSGAVSNDPLLIALATWTLAVCAKGLREGWSARLLIGAGVLAGLSLYTKTSGLALIPILALAAFLPQFKRPTLPQAGLLVGLPILLFVPWMLRNQALYGDLLGMSVFNQAFAGSMSKVDPSRLADPAHWKGVLQLTAMSFVGLFGYMDIPLPQWTYSAMWVGGALLIFGWLRSLRKEEWRFGKAVTLLNGAFLLVVIALFIQFNMQYFQGQARYLFPALGPIACGMGIGLVTVSRCKGVYTFYALAVILIGLNLWILTWLPGGFRPLDS